MSAGPHVSVTHILSTILDSIERRVYTLRIRVDHHDTTVRGWIAKRPTGWEDDIVGRPSIHAEGDAIRVQSGEGLNGSTRLTDVAAAESTVARLRTALSEVIRSITEGRNPIADIRERALAMDVAISRWRAGLQAGAGVSFFESPEHARHVLEARSEFEVDVFQLPNGAEIAVGEANEPIAIQVTPPSL